MHSGLINYSTLLYVYLYVPFQGPKNEITQLEKEVTHPEAMKFDVHTGVKRDYKRFFILQNTTHYSKLHLETKIQDLHFHLKYNNLSVYNENSVEEKNCYHLVVHEDEGSISSVLVCKRTAQVLFWSKMAESSETYQGAAWKWNVLIIGFHLSAPTEFFFSLLQVKDIGIKPDNRMTAIRFGCWGLQMKKPHILLVLSWVVSLLGSLGLWCLWYFLWQWKSNEHASSHRTGRSPWISGYPLFSAMSFST